MVLFDFVCLGFPRFACLTLSILEFKQFHGRCDLVLFNNPDFGNGLGLRVHTRTKIETSSSYIEQVVVQIGDQMLQLNGASNPDGGLVTGSMAS